MKTSSTLVALTKNLIGTTATTSGMHWKLAKRHSTWKQLVSVVRANMVETRPPTKRKA